MTEIDIPDNLPTIIRGCGWDDGWEFDGPLVIYYPFFKYGEGNNVYCLRNMVEDVCIDIEVGDVDYDAMRRCLEEQCGWRGWSLKGFARRKAAHHMEFRIRWSLGTDGSQSFEPIDERLQLGPFGPKSGA